MNGDTYEGDFSRGVPNGEHTMKTKNNNNQKFTIMFIGGVPNTNEINFTFPNGDEYKGQYGRDYLNNVILKGESVITYTDGRIYRGNNLNGIPSSGVMTYQNGDTHNGTFNNGILYNGHISKEGQGYNVTNGVKGANIYNNARA